MRARLLVLVLVAAASATTSCRTSRPLDELEPHSRDPVAAKVVKTIVYIPAAVVVGSVYVACAMAQGAGRAQPIEAGLGPLPGSRRVLWE
jgi:predicted small secreted protein